MNSKGKQVGRFILVGCLLWFSGAVFGASVEESECSVRIEQFAEEASVYGYRLAKGRGLQDIDAQDVSQMSALNAVKSHKNVRGPHEGYIVQIAKNSLADWFRRVHFKIEKVPKDADRIVDELPDGRLGDGVSLEFRQIFDFMNQQLEVTPDGNCRSGRLCTEQLTNEIFRLWLSGASNQVTAAVLGVSEDYVAVRAFEAKKQLSKAAIAKGFLLEGGSLDWKALAQLFPFAPVADKKVDPQTAVRIENTLYIFANRIFEGALKTTAVNFLRNRAPKGTRDTLETADGVMRRRLDSWGFQDTPKSHVFSTLWLRSQQVPLNERNQVRIEALRNHKKNKGRQFFLNSISNSLWRNRLDERGD